MHYTDASKPSRSYREEEVFFAYGKTTLAGMLSLPEAPGPYPALVYLPGSGPAARDGLGMLPQHWEAFAQYGIASLSWDKPGVGASTGDWTAQTMEDRAREGLAAIRFLKERKEIVRNSIGCGGMKELQRSFLKPAGQKVFAPGYLDLMATWVQQRFVLKTVNLCEWVSTVALPYRVRRIRSIESRR